MAENPVDTMKRWGGSWQHKGRWALQKRIAWPGLAAMARAPGIKRPTGNSNLECMLIIVDDWTRFWE